MWSVSGMVDLQTTGPFCVNRRAQNIQNIIQKGRDVTNEGTSDCIASCLPKGKCMSPLIYILQAIKGNEPIKIDMLPDFRAENKFRQCC